VTFALIIKSWVINLLITQPTHSILLPQTTKKQKAAQPLTLTNMEAGEHPENRDRPTIDTSSSSAASSSLVEPKETVRDDTTVLATSTEGTGLTKSVEDALRAMEEADDDDGWLNRDVGRLWSKQFACYSSANYHNSNAIEHGDKIILPPSSLTELCMFLLYQPQTALF